MTEAFQYGRVWQGERVSLSAIKEQSPLCAVAARVLWKKGIATRENSIVYIPKLLEEKERVIPFSQLELTPATLTAPTAEAITLLERYGKSETYETPTHQRITILPTCTVPIARLIEANLDSDYRVGLDLGNFRRVYIPKRDDGTGTALVAKSPERVLTASQKVLDSGKVFWGGRRSGESCIYIQGNAIVEEQTLWEAIILLELARIGLKAELPQALIEHPDGSRELIVGEIKHLPAYEVNASRNSLPTPNDNLSSEEIKRRSEETGLVTADFFGGNTITDLLGYDHAIDVNRWRWPPYTDNFQKRLVNAVHIAIAERDK